MIEVAIGPTYPDALKVDREALQQWRGPLRRTLDLVARFNTAQAEVAATVHFVVQELTVHLGRAPATDEVINEVEQWKIRRKPPIERSDILAAVVTLASQGWIDVVPDKELAEALTDDLAFAYS